jgi:hypothetical protein
MLGHSPSDTLLTYHTRMPEHRRRVAAAERRSALDYGLWGIEPTRRPARNARALAARLCGLLRRRNGQSLGHNTVPSRADA